MKPQIDVVEVAGFMNDCLKPSGVLYQDEVAVKIKNRFGNACVYTNQSGNLAIARNILSEFRRQTPDVVWERGERCWRARAEYDKQGSRAQT